MVWFLFCFGFFTACQCPGSNREIHRGTLHLKEESQRKLHSYWVCSNKQVRKNSKTKLCHLEGLVGHKLCHILGVSSWLMTQQVPSIASHSTGVPCKTGNIRMVLSAMEVDKCRGNQGAGILRLQEQLLFLPHATLLGTYYLWF